jgi:addiction module RelB/DinJ family antitoxin
MKPAIINIKVDASDKRKAQELAHALGVSLSGVMKMYLKDFLRNRRIEVGMESEEPSEQLIKDLKQSEKDRKEGYASPAFKNAKDAIAWLNDSNAKYENGESV